MIQYARTLPFVSEIYLAGHSQGGLTAILAAGMMPEYFMAARIVPLEECIRNYHGRILLIHGDDDASVPIEYAEKLADKEKKQSGDFTFAVIKGADHDYTRQGNLDQFTGAIRHFLNSRSMMGGQHDS